jgi:hypothetical protein
MRNKLAAAGRWLLAFAWLAGCGAGGGGGRQPDTTGGGGTAGAGGSTNTGTGGSTAGTGGGGPAAPAPWSLPGVDLISNGAACTPGTVTVGSTPLRRISRIEYNNMVRDLLNDTTKPATGFVSETKVAGFNSNAYGGSQVNALINRQYLEAAEALAANAVTGNNLNNMLSCASQANDDCAKTFINGFVLRAFRGQLDDGEALALYQLYTDTKAQFDFATGIQAMITSVLTSPRFLFVLEFGTGGAGPAVALSQYELAARLALYLWRSVPDDALMQAAKSNQLATPDQIETQAKRMLADPKAIDALQDFANQWLDIENMDAVTKDTAFQSVWSPQVAKALHAEALITFSKLVITENGDLPTLLTSPSSYVTQDLAKFYNVTVANADSRTMLDSASQPRSGILTGGAFLAMHGHPLLPAPVLRGKIIMANVMCRPVQPPSSVPGLVIPPPPSAFTTGQTTRQAFEIHTTAQICANCHVSMDAVGFAFDAYNATGMLYPQDLPDPTKFDENGAAVDSSGTFGGTNSDLDGVSFTDAVDMTHKLAQSNLVKACFAVEQFRYALDRAEANADACSLQQAYRDFSANNFNLQKLIVSIVRSDAFRARTVVNAGSACQ